MFSHVWTRPEPVLLVASSGPAGWPRDVPPPDFPGWEKRAAGWLFDQCPADLRAHEVFRRQPLVLAYVAAGQLSGSLTGLQSVLASCRADLRDVVAADVLADAVAALQLEQVRLVAAERAVLLVADALRGARQRPKL